MAVPMTSCMSDDGHLRAPTYLTFLLLKNADSFSLSVYRTCLVGEKVEGDGGADDLLHVGADDGHLRAPTYLTFLLLKNADSSFLSLYVRALLERR
jgi:hypothetical protein